MYIKNQTDPHSLHQIFITFNKYRHVFLGCTLAIWSVVPILGIIFLLLYCQINLSSNQKQEEHKPLLNLLPLVLIIFTIGTYIATFKSFNDTDIYINLYKSLNQESPFTLPDIDMEPGAFILPKYLSRLTSGDELAFLLFQSLTMNTAFVFYSVIFVPEFYPLIILVNIMSQGYYFQLFWMRQFYSFIFIVPAICTNVFLWRWLCIYLAFFTHNSSLMYGATLAIASIKNLSTGLIGNIRKSLKIGNVVDRPKFFILGFSLLIVGLIVTSMGSFSEMLGNSASLDSSISSKISVYSSDSDFNMDNFTLVSQARVILDYLTVFIFVINADYRKADSLFFRWLILLIVVFALYIGSFISGFNLRISVIFFCLPGFFYIIPLKSGKLDGPANIYTYILCTSMFLRIVYFFNNLITSYQTENYLTFWGGETLTTPITGYIEFFLKCLASGLKLT
jgi:EpsG family